MLNHTPGPWSYDFHHEIVYAGDGQNDCDIIGEIRSPGNGYLCAAAPQLLMACRQALVAAQNTGADLLAKVLADAIIEATGEDGGAGHA